MRIHSFLILLFLFVGIQVAFSQLYTLKSPDNHLVVQLKTGDLLTCSISLNDKVIISSATLNLILDEPSTPKGKFRVRKALTSSNSSHIEPVVPVKQRFIADEYSQLVLKFRDGLSLEFRAYNDGVAYRFVTNKKGVVQVLDEQLDLTLPLGSSSYFPTEESMYSHYERQYPLLQVDEIPEGDFCSLPVLFNVSEVGRMLFTEADVFDFPNAFLQKKNGTTFTATFPEVVIKTSLKGDRTEVPENAPYIANVNGQRSYPWRVFIISDDDAAIAESNLVFQLSRPCVLKDPSWIKPGKVAWDWYNANNITGVDFKSGLNTQTYRFYIDFASKYGLEYIILDEGWSKSTTNLLETHPEIDLNALVDYGNSKNVGIILWALWHPLQGNEDEIFSRYHEWGIKGVKVDFMQRADQGMVNSYEKIAATAANYHLLVDFHGAYKPAGLNSAYPNVLSFEGVMGNENNKWSDLMTPEHHLTLPFTRMVAGPMDFTPGSMRNAQKSDYCISWANPMSLGTRSHQVAMYVIFESPLQMLCESPSLYLKEPEVTGFIAQIPTTWDETHVLQAEVSDYIFTARRKGEDWYLAAMTDWTPRALTSSLSFLPAGNYMLRIFRDGPNADKNAIDYFIETQKVTNLDNLQLDLAPGGGWVGIITPEMNSKYE
jgi:alpha-glucosidase